MKPVTACFGVLSLNIFAGMIYMAWNHSWLLSTGIIRLTDKPVQLEVAAIALFVISLIIIYVHNGQHSYKDFCVLAGFSGVGIAIICYFAMNWFISPEMFLQELDNKWEQNINTNTLYPIEQTFRCCGFRNVGEFPGDKCAASKSVPCMKAMRKQVTDALAGNSIFLACQMLAQGFVVFAFRQICMKRERPAHSYRQQEL